MTTYRAYRYGKLGQSFIMKNQDKQSVFEANLVKFRLFSACDYEFVNKLSLSTNLRKVGKTKTTQMDGITTSSYFKLDGENVFDILEKKGVSFKTIAKLDLLHPEFALIDNNNNTVATYKMNVLGEKQEGVFAIGNKQRDTVIDTDSEDLELVFLGAFILSRVDFSMFLL